MAKLMLIGNAAQVELFTDPDDGLIIAGCRLHPDAQRTTGHLCRWTAEYDDLNDASEYAADHADTGRD